MSRIAKQPIEVPASTTVTIANGQIAVKGPHGELSRKIDAAIGVELQDKNHIVIKMPENLTKAKKALSGTTRALIANMVKGVHAGFERRLNLVGVGYRAQVQGQKIKLTVGFSHPVEHPIPAGVKVETPTPTEIILKSADKHLLGQLAANLRSYRPPEAYKGKGIRYANEKIILKEAKKK
jgi:large subunit ribosomal protein L6